MRCVDSERRQKKPRNGDEEQAEKNDAAEKADFGKSLEIRIVHWAAPVIPCEVGHFVDANAQKPVSLQLLEAEQHQRLALVDAFRNA